MEIGERTKEEINEDMRERLEHRDVILAIRAIFATNSGPILFKYLFKHFDVAQLPEPGLESQMLYEYLGMLRAGNSIFKLASEADFETTGRLLAEIEKDKYARLLADATPRRD